MPEPLSRWLRVAAGWLIVLAAAASPAASAQATHNVVLVTLDGVRVQELFGGYDTIIAGAEQEFSGIRSPEELRSAYWRATPEDRRRALMPFFWDSLVPRGVLLGDQAHGSGVTLANPHRFSAPGYLELLTGQYQPDVTSNDPTRYPHRTILELVREGLGLRREEVALFASWENFQFYGASDSAMVVLNAGFDTLPDPLSTTLLRELGHRQRWARPIWEGARLDAFTGALALEYLRTRHPRLVYLAFNDTDDLSHSRRYDRLLDALHATDAFLRELWDGLEADPAYRGRTTLIVTTDHGRGRRPEDWDDHGREVAGAEEIWILMVGAGIPARGEVSGGPPARQAQVAATVLQLLGLPHTMLEPGADPPLPVTER
jgi:hypothetical protein